jgi:hypothetical protein
MDKLERRFVSFAEFRDSENTKTLRGHAATFDDVYSLGMFEERIAPGAFEACSRRLIYLKAQPTFAKLSSGVTLTRCLSASP